MSWGIDQQRLLVAMGYRLYRPLTIDAPVAASVAAMAPPASPDAMLDERDQRLLRALQRAAGRNDLAGMDLPPLAQLRADPQAKRALWPSLRQLRRRH